MPVAHPKKKTSIARGEARSVWHLLKGTSGAKPRGVHAQQPVVIRIPQKQTFDAGNRLFQVEEIRDSQDRCKNCGAYGVLDPREKGYSYEEKQQILAAYRERESMRGVKRIFGVSRNTLSKWLKKGI